MKRKAILKDIPWENDALKFESKIGSLLNKKLRINLAAWANARPNQYYVDAIYDKLEGPVRHPILIDIECTWEQVSPEKIQNITINILKVTTDNERKKTNEINENEKSISNREIENKQINEKNIKQKETSSKGGYSTKLPQGGLEYDDKYPFFNQTPVFITGVLIVYIEGNIEVRYNFLSDTNRIKVEGKLRKICAKIKTGKSIQFNISAEKIAIVIDNKILNQKTSIEGGLDFDLDNLDSPIYISGIWKSDKFEILNGLRISIRVTATVRIGINPILLRGAAIALTSIYTTVILTNTFLEYMDYCSQKGEKIGNRLDLLYGASYRIAEEVNNGSPEQFKEELGNKLLRKDFFQGWKFAEILIEILRKDNQLERFVNNIIQDVNSTDYYKIQSAIWIQLQKLEKEKQSLRDYILEYNNAK